MPEDIGALRGELGLIRTGSEGFFADAKRLPADQSIRARARALRIRIDLAVSRLSGVMKESALCREIDQSNLRYQVKVMTAALRFQRYEYEPPYQMSDEDRSLGVRPGIENEWPILPEDAEGNFLAAFDEVEGLLNLCAPAAPKLGGPEQSVTPPGTAIPAPGPPPRPSKNRPGPSPKDHKRVAEIVEEIAARYDGEWKSTEALAEICAKLDSEYFPVPKPWRQWEPEPARSWALALTPKLGAERTRRRRLVERSLEESVKVARRTASKLS